MEQRPHQGETAKGGLGQGAQEILESAHLGDQGPGQTGPGSETLHGVDLTELEEGAGQAAEHRGRQHDLQADDGFGDRERGHHDHEKDGEAQAADVEDAIAMTGVTPHHPVGHQPAEPGHPRRSTQHRPDTIHEGHHRDGKAHGPARWMAVRRQQEGDLEQPKACYLDPAMVDGHPPGSTQPGDHPAGDRSQEDGCQLGQHGQETNDGRRCPQAPLQ